MKELNVRDNKVGNEGALHLSKCLHKLEILGLGFCGITFLGVQSISRELMLLRHKVTIVLYFAKIDAFICKTNVLLTIIISIINPSTSYRRNSRQHCMRSRLYS